MFSKQILTKKVFAPPWWWGKDLMVAVAIRLQSVQEPSPQRKIKPFCKK
jgi:hypothetical protein